MDRKGNVVKLVVQTGLIGHCIWLHIISPALNTEYQILFHLFDPHACFQPYLGSREVGAVKQAMQQAMTKLAVSESLNTSWRWAEVGRGGRPSIHDRTALVLSFSIVRMFLLYILYKLYTLYPW